MGKTLAERQIVVQSVPQRCFEALVDFESYPTWQSAVRRCSVISRDGDGRGRRVQFEIGARPKPISYVADYAYEHPHHITWELVEGDVDDVEGEFVLEDRGDGTTLATFGLRIEATARRGDSAASTLSDQVTKWALEDLKARVESRA